MHEAANYETRCEALAALVEFARTMIEQARAAEAERAREAAEAAEAAVAVEAVGLLVIEAQEQQVDITLGQRSWVDLRGRC